MREGLFGDGDRRIVGRDSIQFILCRLLYFDLAEMSFANCAPLHSLDFAVTRTAALACAPRRFVAWPPIR